ncbi:hypothetical protein Tco_1294741 [Tanacetum coccineum]
MEKFETPPDSPPISVIDPDDQPMRSNTRTAAPTPSSAIIQRHIPNNFHIKEILDAGGIFLYNTPNEVFKILEDKVLLKLDFSDDFQNNSKPKTVVSAGGSNNNPDHTILMEKFEALATKMNSEFLIKNARRSWKRMKNQMVELENQINQGLRNRQAIIENLKRQFKYLEKIQHSKSLPHTINMKPRHEFVYKPPSIRNENDKGDAEFIEEDVTKPIPTMPNPNLINSNSPSVSPFLKDCTVHIPYTNAKTFADNVLSNHVGNKELKSYDGVGTGRMIKKEKDEEGMPKEPNKEWKLNEKVVPHNKEVYHHQWHPTEIPHLNRIVKES